MAKAANPLASRLLEAVGRVAFIVTGARWASELTWSARVDRRMMLARRAHLAAGGTIITVQRAGSITELFEAPSA